jgi:hypothetical protein
VSLWQEIVFGWLIVFMGPKLLVIPVWRGMWKAMKETERLDEADRVWLEAQRHGNGGEFEPVPARFRPRTPRRPRGPDQARRAAPRSTRSRG